MWLFKVFAFCWEWIRPLITYLWSSFLVWPYMCWSSSFLWAPTEEACFVSLPLSVLPSLPRRSTVVSIWPNGTSHVALPSHAGITILSSYSMPRHWSCINSLVSLPELLLLPRGGIPREWSQLVSREAVGPSPILCGRMALSLPIPLRFRVLIISGVESPSLIVLIWN